MIRRFLKRIGLLVYAQHYREKLFPAKSQVRERNALSSRKEFYRQFLTPGDLCFDVGANIGNRTKVFLELGARVVAVEPQQECTTRLKLRFGNKIELVEKALGEKENQGVLYVGESTAISSLSRDWIDTVGNERFKGREWNKQINVNITTLDKLISQYGIPRFCKIDVEGFEEEVLKGLSTTIPFLSLEYASPEKMTNISACFQRLHRLGNFKCNFTVGEKMKLELESWVSPDEVLRCIQQKSSKPIFGGVYVKF